MTDKQPSQPTTLDRDQVWQVLDTERSRLADLLDSLSDQEWTHPSLCTGWTVKDVAAHLTMQELGLGAELAVMFQWRGSMDRTVAHVVRRRATALSTGQLVARIRGMVGSRRHNFGSSNLESLVDCLVHTQDIAIPLGRRHDMPAAVAAVAASRVLTMRWPPPLPSVRTVAGFRLAATDTPWTAGDGPQVHGPMAALLLVCCGRTVALPQLSGPGASALTARFAPQ